MESRKAGKVRGGGKRDWDIKLYNHGYLQYNNLNLVKNVAFICVGKEYRYGRPEKKNI